MGDKAQRRPVQIGLTDGTDVEIVTGVKAGEMVIVEGQNGLPDDATIAIQTEEDEDEAPAADKKDEKKDEKDDKGAKEDEKK